MKTAKLVIGIISMVLFILIVFQSCAAGMVNAIEDNGESSGMGGLLLAFFMLIGGIVGTATRKSKGGGIVAGIFYLIAGLVGASSYGDGTYGDLQVWYIMCFLFAAFFIVGSITMKKAPKDKSEAE